MKSKKILSIIMSSFILSSYIVLSGCGEQEPDVTSVSSDDVLDINQVEQPVTSSSDVNDILSVGDSGYIFDESDSHVMNFAKIIDSTSGSENVVLSPLSLDLALGMIANCGDANVQSKFVPYLGMTVDEYNDYASNINNSNAATIVNRVFVDDEYEILPDINDTLGNNYNGSASSLDLDNSNASSTINQIFDDKTNSAIKSAVSDNDINTCDTALISALHFKDEWKTPIKYTHENEIFMNVDSTEELVTMLDFTEDIYYENDNATGFMKEYSDGRYGFIGILPKNEGDFSLTELDLDSFLKSKSDTTVVVQMPEFSFDTKLNLTNILSSLGLDIFGDNVYTKLVADTAMRLDKIIQSTQIEVDKNGTEASAVTVGTMLKTIAPMDALEEIKYVTIDRPFAFVIYDFENDAPLFMGKVLTVNN